MLQQPRVPPTGQRQAIEVHIKWREVLDYKRELLRCLSIATGWGVDKLDADMQRPLYMRPQVRPALSCDSMAAFSVASSSTSQGRVEGPLFHVPTEPAAVWCCCKPHTKQ